MQAGSEEFQNLKSFEAIDLDIHYLHRKSVNSLHFTFLHYIFFTSIDCLLKSELFSDESGNQNNIFFGFLKVMPRGEMLKYQTVKNPPKIPQLKHTKWVQSSIK